MNVDRIAQTSFAGALAGPVVARVRNCKVTKFAVGQYDIEWPSGPVGIDPKDLDASITIAGTVAGVPVIPQIAFVTDRKYRLFVYDAGAVATDDFSVNILFSRVLGAGA